MRPRTKCGKQLPILRDDGVTSYRGGPRPPAGRAPFRAELRHPGSDYTFDVVNVREINAFALPGGPMFVNRGHDRGGQERRRSRRRDGARDQPRRPAARHGAGEQGHASTRSASSPARSLGAIIGGSVGQRHRAGLAVRPRHRVPAVRPRVRAAGRHRWARRSWRAPATTRATWRTCSRRSRSRADRAARVAERPPEPRQSLRRTSPRKRSRCASRTRSATRRASSGVQARLEDDAAAPTTEEATKNAATAPARRARRRRHPPVASRRPSSSYTAATPKATSSRSACRRTGARCTAQNAVTFAPDGAYGRSNGQSVFTHGVEIGVARNETHDLQTATDELIDSLRDSNPSLTRGRPLPPGNH